LKESGEKKAATGHEGRRTVSSEQWEEGCCGAFEESFLLIKINGNSDRLPSIKRMAL
jgi:hypothetical protein